MKQNTLFIALAIIGLIMLVGCGVAPVQSTSAETVEDVETTTRVDKSEPVLVTSAEQAPGAWQASPAQGRPVIGRYEAQPLPNGEVALTLESDTCHLSSLIVSAGDVSAIWPAVPAQGQPVAGLYETQLLPNGEVAIKLEQADAAGELSC